MKEHHAISDRSDEGTRFQTAVMKDLPVVKARMAVTGKE
jgi:hypothetical protein